MNFSAWVMGRTTASELLDLLVQAADIRVILGGLLVNLHGLDAAVVLRGEHVEDEIRVLIDAHQIRGLQLVCIRWTEGARVKVGRRKKRPAVFGRLGRERNGGGARSWAADALTSVDETDDGQEDGLPVVVLSTTALP